MLSLVTALGVAATVYALPRHRFSIARDMSRDVVQGDALGTDGCSAKCDLLNQSVQCRFLVNWAASFQFDGPDECLKAYAYALVRCSACHSCAFSDSGCLPAQPQATSHDGTPQPQKERESSPIPYLPRPVWKHDVERDISGFVPRLRTIMGDRKPPEEEAAGSPGAYVNHYDAANPLRIAPAARRSDNFFLVIGGWGEADGPGHCQRMVAEGMKVYVAEQRALGKTLLFVASVGGNFYWSGASPRSFEEQWAMPYGVWAPGTPLFGVPWLSVLGKHDLGNNDPYALCPGRRALHFIRGQPYGSHHFNADRNPLRPDSGCTEPAILRTDAARCKKNTTLYWLPDYSYHYELPGADLEVIALDTNAGAIDELGGGAEGHDEAFRKCGGRSAVQRHLRAVGAAAEGLLHRRAQRSRASTVVILQHYPGRCMREFFEAALPEHRRGKVRVLCAYGEQRGQMCHSRDTTTGQCDSILSGGGGACCAPVVDLAGFAAVHLGDDGGFTSDVESASVRLPKGTCTLDASPPAAVAATKRAAFSAEARS